MQTPPSKRYGRILIERAWVIVLCVGITLGAAAAYVSVAPREYTAEAQMLVSPAPTTDSTLVSLPVLHSSGDPTRDVLTASSLITSTQVASALVQALHIHKSPDALLTEVQATPIGQSNLVAVQATARSASEAQSIANGFVMEVVATRRADLHDAAAAQIPALQARVARLPQANQSGPGTLGDQLTELEQLQSSNDPTITVAALANRPSSPSSPRASLALAAGLIGGLILGVSAAFGIDALDPRLRRPEQLREIFDAPVLAEIPGERRRRTSGPILPNELSSAGAEGYRTLRTLLASRTESGVPRSVLLTSCSAGDGKTTSAINLAASLARGGSRVILLEADLRKPSLASALGLQVEYGIEDVLAGDIDLDEALSDVRLGSATVRVLPVCRPGFLRSADAELADSLASPAAGNLIKAATELGDYAVIDSPPLTSVSETMPLARMADDVVVVARVGRANINDLGELRYLLIDHGVAVTGTLLVGGNRFGRRARRGRYQYAADGAAQPLSAQRVTHHETVSREGAWTFQP